MCLNVFLFFMNSCFYKLNKKFQIFYLRFSAHFPKTNKLHLSCSVKKKLAKFERKKISGSSLLKGQRLNDMSECLTSRYSF